MKGCRSYPLLGVRGERETKRKIREREGRREELMKVLNDFFFQIILRITVSVFERKRQPVKDSNDTDEMSCGPESHDITCTCI